VDLKKLHLPMFVVGTETDHVAPWHSVYKVRGLTRSADYTFLLTSGGHNAGIVSGPVHPKRRHRLLTWSDATTSMTPEEWLKKAPLHEGSWWPAWQHWLATHSAAKQLSARAVAAPASGDLGEAPGSYVRG
jgi:polyhydroxyalkanoate synthase